MGRFSPVAAVATTSSVNAAPNRHMKPSRYDQLVARTSGLRKLIQACGGCGAVGLRPGILATRAGDYGWRESVSMEFEELRLNDHGLCPVCAEQFSANIS